MRAPKHTKQHDAMVVYNVLTTVASYLPFRQQARLALVDKSLSQWSKCAGIVQPSFAPLIESHAKVVQHEHFSSAITILGANNEYSFMSARTRFDKVEISVSYMDMKQVLSVCEPKNFKKIMYRLLGANKQLSNFGAIPGGDSLGVMQFFETLGTCEDLDDVIEMD